MTTDPEHSSTISREAFETAVLAEALKVIAEGCEP